MTIMMTLTEGKSLNKTQAFKLMKAMLSELLNENQISWILGIYQQRKPEVEEVTGFIEAIRAEQLEVMRPEMKLIDTCGTGGDHLNTFNVSTTAAFVAAAAGAKVAKHGNRAVSGKSGAFDLVEALELPIRQNGNQVSHDLHRFGLGFYYAPHFHPTLGAVGPIRRSLGVKTFFNMLGPLLNPVNADVQLIGVYDSKVMALMADYLASVHIQKAMLVHGTEGLDEISICGDTQVIFVESGKVHKTVISPEMYGFERVSLEAIRGGNAVENAHRLEAILKNESSISDRHIIQMNAGAAIYLYGLTSNLREGMALAGQVLECGAAYGLLNEMRCSR